MDPISIVGLIGSVVSILDVVAKGIQKLTDLKRRHHDAPAQISTLIGQLYVIQAAITTLDSYKSSILAQSTRYQELALQLDSALDCFRPLMESLNQYLYDLEMQTAGVVNEKSKLLYLWNERDIETYLGLLDRQVNALNLFLNAVQW